MVRSYKISSSSRYSRVVTVGLGFSKGAVKDSKGAHSNLGF